MSFEKFSESSRVAAPADFSYVSDQLIPACLNSEVGSRELKLGELLEWAVALMTNKVGNETVEDAFKEFKNQTGLIFHDDWFFHQRSSYFLNHLLLEHVFKNADDTGLNNLVADKWISPEKLNQENRKNLAELASFRHSLFQIQKIKENSMSVKDLLSHEKVDVVCDSNYSFEYLQKAYIFQGYLLPYVGQFFMTEGLVFHSKVANRAIKKLAKQYLSSENKNKTDLIFDLAKAQVQTIRNARVDGRTYYKKLIHR